MSTRYLRHFRSDVFWWEPDGRVVRLSPGDGVYLMACVHPAGDGAVFWGGAQGRPRLWWSDGGPTLEALTPGSVSARYPAFDLSGRHLVYSLSTDVADTVEQIARDGTSTRAPFTARAQIVVRRLSDGAEWPLTSGEVRDERPALSPDGTEVVFVSNRGGVTRLWTVATAGGEAQPLRTGPRPYRPWWSVDGRRIYFFTLGPDRDQIHSVPATGGVQVPFGADDRGDTHGPYADVRGRHLLAHSTRDAGQRPHAGKWALYEFPLDGGTPVRLSPPGHARGAHVTRSRNGIMTFDVARRASS